MKLLFVGEDWSGSDARALRLALARNAEITLESVAIEDTIRRRGAGVGSLINRLLLHRNIRTLESVIRLKCQSFRPDVIVIAKGWHFDSTFVRSLRDDFAPIVNAFPDASPHAHGERLKDAIGQYDLVITTKKFHPPLWRTLYGYPNRCVHVGHGYDAVHLHSVPQREFDFDVIMIATARSEYEDLIRQISPPLVRRGRSIVLGGNGWKSRQVEELGVKIIGPIEGQLYMDWLRRAKIVIAPVQTVVSGEHGPQPGDEVTARTFQCAAGFTFFIHRRTNEARELFDETTEVPMYDDPDELIQKIEFYLESPSQRNAMAAAAHARAVPAYSIDARAIEIIDHLARFLTEEDDGVGDDAEVPKSP